MTIPNELPVERPEEPVEGDGNGVEETRSHRLYSPATDILETNDAFVLTADLPGVDPASIDVTYEDGVLTLRATVGDLELEGFTQSLAEFDFGDYKRSFSISEPVDADAIEAGYKEGALTIRLPKTSPTRRKVSVTTG